MLIFYKIPKSETMQSQGFASSVLILPNWPPNSVPIYSPTVTAPMFPTPEPPMVSYVTDKYNFNLHFSDYETGSMFSHS